MNKTLEKHIAALIVTLILCGGWVMVLAGLRTLDALNPYIVPGITLGLGVLIYIAIYNNYRSEQ
ncbi:hypothetical protein HXA31_20540 [Salipaludibacillus agaradhaerens]|jgi:hypothetical protein|uniref:Uncharacterized protein n=1 Tax=Salipaludibacillus agaradhaerens TaxID=76935 RepID=A0A9Q4B215_SALAG|nr:hypothetical protein [Salipaludibacillus agaradhaerens]MCR6096877.1 hypothetical protein [Salipaludibacillus agaradhaerens]MCR6116721.1 hypothetical protein [Salipaludibacillus agaradhaerens]